MRISIVNKKDIIFIYSGSLNLKVVEKIKDDDYLGKRFVGCIYAIKRSLSLIRNKIESQSEDEIIVFEMNNRTLVDWFRTEIPNRGYESYFYDLLQELNNLPMRYTFVYSKVPIASKLSNEVQRGVELTGLEELLNA